MKPTLEQRLISARPEGHPSNPVFVQRTLTAIKTEGSDETFSQVLRTIDIPKKENLFMRLKSLSKPTLIGLALLGTLLLSGGAYAAYHAIHKPAVPQPTPHHAVSVDPTAKWTPYSSSAGQFSVRYPSTWVQPTNREACGAYTFDRNLYLGPDAQSVLKCGTENGGQMSITSTPGQKGDITWDFTIGYKDVIKKTIKVDGVVGDRTSAVAIGQPQDPLAFRDGTIVVEYVFSTKGNIYVAQYMQAPAGSNPSKDVLTDFDTMITKTLTFTTPVAAAQKPALPTLGVPWGSYQKGYGTVKPTVIDNGGDGTGVVSNITWQSWGGPTATGQGTALYVPPNKAFAEGTEEPATVVASNLGTCQGHASYNALDWYFPQHGDSFKPYLNDCTGKFSGQ